MSGKMKANPGSGRIWSRMAARLNSAALFGRTPRTCLQPALTLPFKCQNSGRFWQILRNLYVYKRIKRPPLYARLTSVIMVVVTVSLIQLLIWMMRCLYRPLSTREHQALSVTINPSWGWQLSTARLPRVLLPWWLWRTDDAEILVYGGSDRDSRQARQQVTTYTSTQLHWCAYSSRGSSEN